MMRRRRADKRPSHTKSSAAGSSVEPAGDGQVSNEDLARPSDCEDHGLQSRIMQVSRLATIGEMAAGIAHEINQPLAAITNYARACELLLRNSNEARPDFAEALREIGAEARRAAEIISRLRGLVGNEPAELTATDLNGVITELTNLMQADARVHDVRLRFEFEGALPSVAIDRVRIQHVLLNLLRNALEALDDPIASPREIIVRTTVSDDGNAEFSVTDTGPGIPQHIVDRLFTPFLTTKSNGTGLGLVSSQTIVRAHRGTLGYRPNEPRGASFFVRLPSVKG